MMPPTFRPLVRIVDSTPARLYVVLISADGKNAGAGVWVNESDCLDEVQSLARFLSRRTSITMHPDDRDAQRWHGLVGEPRRRFGQSRSTK